VIDADSYNQWVKETCYVCHPECLDDKYLDTPPDLSPDDVRCLTNIGAYQFFVRTLPKESIRKERRRDFRELMGDPLATLEEEDGPKYDIWKEKNRFTIVQNGLKGTARFDGPVHVPTLAISPRHKPWMSLAPMEVMSQKAGADLAEGVVIIGGLGMGWLAQKVLEKPEVKKVIVVELVSEVVDFFGQPLKERYGDKVEFWIGDVWEYIEQVNFNNLDCILLDIWESYDKGITTNAQGLGVMTYGAKYDPNFKRLRKEVKGNYPRLKLWAWGTPFLFTN